VTVFPTDYYAAVAQVIPLLLVIAMVEARFLGKLDEELTTKETAMKAALDDERTDARTAAHLVSEHSTMAWAYLTATIGLLASLVLGEVAALRALADGRASDAQEGFIICALVTGGTMLVWFPLRIPLRHMRASTGLTKLVGDAGVVILAVMLAVAAFGPVVYAVVAALGGV
jgi:hypothetical protein